MRRWFFIFSLLVTVIAADAARAFTISPLSWRLIVDAGKEQIVSVTITNDEPSVATFQIDVTGVTQGNKGQPVFGDGKDVAEEWVFPQLKNITLGSKQKKKINVTIRPVANAEPGTHYAALVVKKQTNNAGMIGLSTQSAMLLEIAIAGTVHEGLSIDDWSVEKNVVITPAWKTTMVLQNTGTVTAPVAGTVVLSDWRGKKVYEEKLSLGNKIVPGGKRTIAPLIVAKSIWPGPYKADVIISYGQGSNTRATQTLWYIPEWSIGVVLGCIIILLVVAKKIKKKT